MTNKKLLSLDLSTTCTGYCTFNINEKKLLKYGTIVPILDKAQKKLEYPRIQLSKMVSIAKQIQYLIETENPEIILIEEISGSKNRLGQKVLDGLHWIVALFIEDAIKKVTYMDVTGANGWRYLLRMTLTEADKSNNKENKNINKKLKKGTKKQILITPKHLAMRFVNKNYNLGLNIDLDKTHEDICDVISMSHAYLQFIK